MATKTAAFDTAGYASRPVTKAPPWHALVAWDLLFNGLTSGLFLTAAAAELTAPEVFLPVTRAAYPLALAFLLLDLACLVLDLGDPFRFHHMLRVFKPTSPMSLGTWSLTLYSLPLTVAAALSILPPASSPIEWTRKAAVVVGVLPALASAIYKGVLLSTTAQPAWRDARWLGGYLANSALVLGCAALLAIAVFMKQQAAIAVLRPAVVVLLVINVAPLALLIADLRMSRVFMPYKLFWLTAIDIGGGTIIPIALLVSGNAALLSIAAMLSLLAASVVSRFAIVRLPHTAALGSTPA